MFFGCYFFRRVHVAQVDLCDFDDLWRLSWQGYAFWEFIWYGSPYRWPNTLNIFRAWIGIFKPNSQNTKTCILSNLPVCYMYIDLNQILHTDKDHQILFVGGPNMRATNPRWRTTAILEKIAISTQWLEWFWWYCSSLFVALLIVASHWGFVPGFIPEHVPGQIPENVYTTLFNGTVHTSNMSRDKSRDKSPRMCMSPNMSWDLSRDLSRDMSRDKSLVWSYH